MKTIQLNILLTILLSFSSALNLMANEDKEAAFKKELVAMKKIKDPKQQVLWGVNLSLAKFSEYQSRPKEVFYSTPTSDLGIRAGSDPSLIKDPHKRKAYEDMIKKNNENIKLLNNAEITKSQTYILLSEIENIAQSELNEADKKYVLSITKTIRNLFQP